MYATATLTLDYRADLALLMARWLAEPSARAQHEAEYTTLLQYGQQHHTSRWLLDVRRRPQPCPLMAAWIVQEWLPQVVAALAPQRLRLAYLISPARGEAVQQDTALHATVQTATQPTQPYDLMVFGDEGLAMRWLLA
ncbi:hypothetical protein J0X19_19205 [Hymenobacter sp. BT186]|uniref:STAS/SEC14 domain-containing protein n=1 Tax=Hymenobacter telluris TaxID=2816474 RepID=A0A939F0K8_9BACT|nr:hypothetical protein [Hymenobacter telluris]MBO0360097.1 hypothetical protein [Hymenobacter telluris]MBW3376124.1 hypothetical protein [Hymenobacter norwichensis]